MTSKKKNNRTILKNIVLVFAVVFFCIVFHAPLENLFTESFVEYGLKYVQTNTVNDIIFSIIGFTLLIHFLIKVPNFRPSVNIVIFLVVLSAFYFIHRNYLNVWNFQSFEFNNNFKYADVLFVFTLCSLLFLILKPTDRNVSGKGSLLHDEPLGLDGVDELGYTSYAKNLASKIKASKFETSFAVGINAKWGVGKTSFIDLLKKELTDKNIIEVNFKPWNSHKPEAIIKDFFDTLEEQIRPYNASLSKQLLEYSNKLISIHDSKITRSINTSLSLLTGNDSLNTLYDKIDASLRQIKRKIVVYIDDVDRLDKKEIIEVVRLIRNTANFYNCFFIVAYDRDYVVKALKDLNEYKQDVFLEKIFQLELTLPYFDKGKLRYKLAEKLNEKLPDSLAPLVKKHVIGTPASVPTYLNQWLENMRDVTRLANSIILNSNNLESEIVFNDLLRLELIRIKHPSVYQLLYRQRNEFLKLAGNQHEKHHFVLNESAEHKAKNNIMRVDDYETALEVYLLGDASEKQTDPKDIKQIIALLRQIFVQRHAWDEENKTYLSVVYPEKFNRYFAYGLLPDSLSENDFSEARKLTVVEFKKKIKIWVDQGLEDEVQKQFENTNTFSDKNDYEKIILGIFHLANQKSKKSQFYSRSKVGYNGDDLFKKLSNRDNSLTKSFYNSNDELRAFVKGLFDAASHPFEFESDFAQFANSQFHDEVYTSPFPLTKEEVKAISIGYFKSHCDQISEFTDTMWDLYYGCKQTNWKSTGSSSYQRFNSMPPEANQIFIDFLEKKDLNGFIIRILDASPGDYKRFNISSNVKDIFGGWTEFKEWLNKQSESNWSFLRDFKTFFDKLEANGFGSTDFIFSEIPIVEWLQKKYER